MQVFVLSGKSILFLFWGLSNKGNDVVHPTLIRAYQTPIRAVCPASLSLFSLTVSHITALQRQVHVVEVAEYIGQVRKRHSKLFIGKLDMEVVFVFSKKDFNFIFKFKQPREAFASQQPVDFGIKQKPYMFRFHFFGQKLEKPMIFALERMKLITLTAMFITSIECRSKVFDARVYRCSEQCEDVT